MNNASATRRRADLQKLRELQSRMRSTFEIIQVVGDPARSIKLRIRIPTARNDRYPQEKQETSDVEVAFPENYPLAGPEVHFATPIWNPNVYASGKWCYDQWNAMENLELFVGRLMKVIAFDPAIVRPESPANAAASQWYMRLRSRQPELFPTVILSGLVAGESKKPIVWKPIK